MAEAIHTEVRFNDQDAAREHLESSYWPKGPVCPHCGGTERNTRLNGTPHRPGLLCCADCRSQFTVTLGTVFDRSKVPLHKWGYASHLMCASKKGNSPKQLESKLDVTYKTAWLMAHGIREAMNIAREGQLGGGGLPVDVDGTFWSNKGKQVPGARAHHHKTKVVPLVERNGHKRSFQGANVSPTTLRPFLQAHTAKNAALMTNEHGTYTKLDRDFASQNVGNHSAKEFARGHITTNTVESSFALLKRGLVCTFDRFSEQHLQRYATEFDCRRNTRQSLGFNDAARTSVARRNIGGKRLTCQRIDAQA